MRRTPREDIEFVGRCLVNTTSVKPYFSDCRYFYKDLMSQELYNILTSMGVQECSNWTSFKANDETYLKALDILKIIIEEEGDGT